MNHFNQERRKQTHENHHVQKGSSLSKRQNTTEKEGTSIPFLKVSSIEKRKRRKMKSENEERLNKK